VADVARVLSRYVDGIMARVFAHRHIEELVACSRVPVINGLSDYNHPCQALGVKLAYVGDANNVAASLLFAAAKVGMDMALVSPEGY